MATGGAITEMLIRSIHAELVAGVRGGSARPGEWRTTQNFVVNSRTKEVVYTPPAADDVPILVRELVEWLREESATHPVLVAGVAQFQLVHIHPFVDGNGRASRLLSTVCLYRAGYDFKRLFTLSEFYDRDRAAFYAALQGARRADLDLTGWLEYFIEGLSTQLQEVRDRGEGAIRADVIARERGLNARQSILLSAFLSRRPMTLADCEALLPDVVRRTVQRDLRALVDEGLLREIGRSPTDPTRHYVLGEL